MLKNSFDSFLFSQLIDGIDSSFAESYNFLAPDHVCYIKTDFITRFRHFSSFESNENGIFENDALYTLFNSKKDFHVDYDETKKLPSIDKSLIQNNIIQNFLLKIFSVSPIHIRNRYGIGVHQVRVITDEKHIGDNAPTLHKDGYDFSADLAICRQNIQGGTTLISTTKKEEDIMFTHNLQPGEFVFFNDRKLFHSATQIIPDCLKEKSYRDMVIIDFLKL
jgi:hypothetical protein